MNIDYLDFGKGKRNMLILPGLSIRPLCGNRKAIEDAFRIFEDDFHVFLFDQREDIEEGYTVEDMAEDAYEKIRELGLSDLYLYGASLGGMMSQCLFLRHPEVVRKAALISTVSKISDDTLLKEWAGYGKVKDSAGLVESFMEKVYTEDFCKQYLKVMKAFYADMSDEEFRKYVIRCEAVAGFDVTSEKLSSPLPVLVLGSKKDKVFDYRDMEQMAKHYQAESYFYDEYSHAVYDEAPDIRQRVKDFYLK